MGQGTVEKVQNGLGHSRGGTRRVVAPLWRFETGRRTLGRSRTGRGTLREV